MNSKKPVSPSQFVEGALFYRTIQTIYDILHEADTRGLHSTLDGVSKSIAVLTLIAKRNPGCFVIPIIHVLPVNADTCKQPNNDFTK